MARVGDTGKAPNRNTGQVLTVTSTRAVRNKIGQVKYCLTCNEEITKPRKNKYYCDNACKQKDYRNRKGT